MSKGEIAGTAPAAVEVEKGKRYFWCACVKSANQPFCDGSHKDTDFAPVGWEATESRRMFFCTCKQTDKAPFCDGHHNDL